MDKLKRLCVTCATALCVFHSVLVAEEAKTTPPVPGESAAQAEPTAPAPDRPDSAKEPFPPDQIEQLVAPIALYPDALLAQILMAATYPLDIVQAHRWVQEHDDLEGEALQEAADQEPWDPSVKALVFFPSVLEFMNDNLDWTQDLGDAVLAQQDEVTDAVQKLRKEAEKTGALKTTEQQRVETQGDTVIVQPAKEEVVYVPTYDPSVVYGQSAPPATTYYPDTYVQPATWSGDSWVNFGVGAVVGGLLTAAILWDRDDYRVYYGGHGYWGRPGYWTRPNYWSDGWRSPTLYVDRRVDIRRGDININRGAVGTELSLWEHNPSHRGGVRYRNAEMRKKYGSDWSRQGISREAARGRERLARTDLSRPQTAEGRRLEGRDIKRPQRRDARAPQTRDLKRPETRQATRPQTREVKRPETRQATRPQTREVKRPETRQATRPQTQQTARPQSRDVARSATRSTGGRSGAFKVDRGGIDRAASRRGATSRSGTARTARSSARGERLRR
jgi:hypothetical protein